MTKVDIIITATDRATKVITRSLNKVRMAFRGMAVWAGVIAGGTIAAGLTAAMRSAMDFEKQMSFVAKTTGLAGEALDELGRGFVNLSKDMPIAAIELAKIGQIAGQLGIQGRENILNFTETVAKMSVAFDMSAEDAATAMAKASAAFGLPITDIEKLASAINQLGNTTAASEREIIAAMYRIAPAAAQLNIAAQDAVALVDTLVAMGQAPEEAGTRLNRALIEMSSKLDKMAEQMGVSVDELKARMDMGDALGVLLDYLNMLGQTESATQKLAMAQDIFGLVGAKAILSLSKAYEPLLKNLETARQAYEEGISLNQEYANATNNVASQMQIFRNRLAAMGKAIGEEALPELSNLIAYLTQLAGEGEGFARSVGRALAKFLRFMLDAVQGARLMYVDIKNALGLLSIAWQVSWKKMHYALAVAWSGIVEKVEAGVNAVIEGINAIGARLRKVTGGRFGWSIQTISLEKYKRKLGDVAKITQDIDRLLGEAARKREAWMKERTDVIEGWEKALQKGKKKSDEVSETTKVREKVAEKASEAFSKPLDDAVEKLEKVKPVRPVTIKVGKVENTINVQEINEDNLERVADMLTDEFLRKLTAKTGFYAGM